MSKEAEKVAVDCGTMTDPVAEKQPEKEKPKEPLREIYQPPPMFFTKQETTVSANRPRKQVTMEAPSQARVVKPSTPIMRPATSAVE